MSDLIAFLRARLDEDEQVARAVSDLGDYDKVYVTRVYVSDDLDPVRSYSEDTDRTRMLARHDPARVLADVDAKRRILDLRPSEPSWYPDSNGGYEMAWEDIVELLALPYADHPDYREEWKP